MMIATAQALYEIEVSTPRALNSGACLLQAAHQMLVEGPSEGTQGSDKVDGLRRALSARLAGLEGDLMTCLTEARIAASVLSLSYVPTDVSLTSATAYSHLLEGKALFALGRAAEAEAAFNAASAFSPASQVGTSADGDSGQQSPPSPPSGLLAHRVAALFDPVAARKGASACRRQSTQGGSRVQQSGEGASTTTDPLAAEVPPQEQLPLSSTDHHEGPQSKALGNEAFLPYGPDSGPLDPRSRFTVPGVAVDGAATADVTLPRNTSWVVVGQLMGASTPKNR